MAIELNARPAGPTKKHKRSLSDIRLFEQRPGVKERLFFTEQLALLLETGTALHAALQLLKQQSGNPGFVRVIDALHHDIAEGKTFSTALARHPSLFPVTYVNLVGAAENGGFLDKVLRELVEMDERREQLHSKLISALSYPVFLILFSTAVVIFVLVAVFPKFADLFSSIRDQLPVTTIALMNASTLLLNYWWALLAGLLDNMSFWWTAVADNTGPMVAVVDGNPAVAMVNSLVFALAATVIAVALGCFSAAFLCRSAA